MIAGGRQAVRGMPCSEETPLPYLHSRHRSTALSADKDAAPLLKSPMPAVRAPLQASPGSSEAPADTAGPQLTLARSPTLQTVLATQRALQATRLAWSAASPPR